MIDTKYPTDTQSRVSGTARLATVHVRYGEITLPVRVLEQLHDDDVHVLISEAGAVVAECDATLVSPKLTEIAWPAHVEAKTRVTVSCPRGGGDVTIALPDPDASAPVAAIPLRHVAADTQVEIPAAAVAVPDDESVAAVLQLPTWPGVEDSEDQTEVLTAVAERVTVVLSPLAGVTVPPSPVVAAEPASVVGALPSGRFALAWFRVVAWFASLVDTVAARVENVGQDVLDHARVVAKVVVAVVVALIFVGTGVGWWLL